MQKKTKVSVINEKLPLDDAFFAKLVLDSYIDLK